MNTVLCITGMHRSGTSLITSWMEACGLPVHDGRVIGADVGNRKGHFEDADFVELQADAIKSRCKGSDGWKVYGNDYLTFSEEYTARAKRLVNKRNDKYTAWGWKDPRSVFFLEEWKRLMPELKVLLLWRRCPEVAVSLLKRSKAASISRGDSVRSWVAHNRKMCEYKCSYPEDTLLLPLHHIIEDDRTCFETINKRLHLGLRYVPIDTVYDKGILHKKGAMFSSALTRMCEWRYGSDRIVPMLDACGDGA